MCPCLSQSLSLPILRLEDPHVVSQPVLHGPELSVQVYGVIWFLRCIDVRNGRGRTQHGNTKAMGGGWRSFVKRARDSLELQDVIPSSSRLAQKYTKWASKGL